MLVILIIHAILFFHSITRKRNIVGAENNYSNIDYGFLSMANLANVVFHRMSMRIKTRKLPAVGIKAN